MLPGNELIRVGLDGRALNGEHLRGMGRCLWELIARGARRHAIRWEVLADRPDLPLHLPGGIDVGCRLFEQRGYRFHCWEQWALPRAVARLKVDLLHCPAGRLPWWQPVPTVVTLHDAMPWRGEEPMWPRGWYTDWLIPRALGKAAAVITDSEASRRDILSLWPALTDKLSVIPLGVGEEYLVTQPEPLGDALGELGIRPPYFLYMGGDIPRKRLDWATRVVESVADPEAVLVVCGVGRDAHERIRQGLSPALRPRVRFAPFVGEADMPRLYQNAVAVLYPTLYEGFGLPALEAQACGTPVLFSPLGSLAELQGPGAVVLPPEDLSAWVAACRTLLEARRNDPCPIDQARAWAGQFSWDVCVSRTLEVYRRALAPHRP